MLLRSPCLLALLVALLPAVTAQSLTTALQQQNLTAFNALVTAYPDLFAGLTNTTILAPSDAAFSAAQQIVGANASNVDIPSLLVYHQLVGAASLKSLSMAQAGNGEVVQTNLKNASEVNMGGVSNVVSVPSAVTLKQQGLGASTGQTSQQVTITGGLGAGANITTGDIAWDGGLLQVLDKVLDLPDVCSKTLAANKVTTFVQYLSRATNLTPNGTNPVAYYDTLTSLTCFVPDDTAFAAQAPIYNAMNTQEISENIGLHVFAGVFYGPETPSGSILVPVWGNGTRGFVFQSNSSGMFIGNSQLIRSDWALSNGVIHVLNKPLNESDSIAITNSTVVFAGVGGPSNGSAPTTSAGPSTSQTAGSSGALGRQTIFASGMAVLAAVAGSILALI
ncbi:hypothetical protein DACRYDRAFT_114418 [Dacryopinax primogenitus]|uniref:FAS1 domain-containing protein n=1 Tax=Dacryopinax primogenitus (strain DJM 731) TaxID=1858805 RepID=M5GCN0_DACPD|nr:uncharacterized protein DACRYDRAFT_114418 [Dacryopinax primogenitus]EJU03967.1 hypothetical protein DACRYDRAFT_114418 [Dacryopinax primogenitus]